MSSQAANIDLQWHSTSGVRYGRKSRGWQGTGDGKRGGKKHISYTKVIQWVLYEHAHRIYSMKHFTLKEQKHLKEINKYKVDNDESLGFSQSQILLLKVKICRQTAVESHPQVVKY